MGVGGRSEPCSMCVVLLPFAHFQCPVENPAFSRSYYELTHGILIGGVYWVCERERAQRRLLQAHRAVSCLGVNIYAHWHDTACT